MRIWETSQTVCSYLNDVSVSSPTDIWTTHQLETNLRSEPFGSLWNSALEFGTSMMKIILHIYKLLVILTNIIIRHLASVACRSKQSSLISPQIWIIQLTEIPKTVPWWIHLHCNRL